jgi:hypothetical protein
LVPFVAFWHLALTPLILSPLSAKFPEFIPLALVLLPVASVAAFLVLIFQKQEKPVENISLPSPAGQGLENLGHPGKGTSSQQTVTSSGIFEPRLAPYTIWVITFFILLASGLYVCERPGGIYTRGDVPHYFTIAKSMHQDLDIDLSNNIKKLTRQQWSGSQRYHIPTYSREGHAYSWHPVGLPLLLAPFFDGVNDHREALILMCIMGAFLASQMYLAVLEETKNNAIALWIWIVLSFSSPLWVYSFEAWPMVPCGLCLLYSWRKISHFHENNPCKLPPHLSPPPSSGRTKEVIILNVSLAWLLWLHDSFILCYGFLGIFLLYHLTRKLRDSRILATVILQALNLGAFFWFHHHWFGKHLFGQDAKFLTFWPGMLGTWFDHHWGMIYAGPIHLLCFILIFIYAFRKKSFPAFMLLILYAGAFLPATATWYWKHRLWGAHPGRKLVGFIPLTCVPLGYFLNKRRTPAFYWLVGFLSILSLAYMTYFIINPRDLDRPLRCLAISLQQFRTVSFGLPVFGKTLKDVPWAHVGTVTTSFLLFALFWVLLLAKESRSRKPTYLFAGMGITLLWIFASVGWMRTHYDAPSPLPWNTFSNCVGKHNRSGIGYPPLQNGLYRYLICKPPLPTEGTDKAWNELSWSIEIKGRLPTYLDLAKGRYRIHITGTGEPSSTGTANIYGLRQGKELYSFPVTVDAEGEFSHEIEINLLPVAKRIRIELRSNDDDITFKEMTIIPIPSGLEPLMARIEQKGEPSGWSRLGE